MEPRDIVQAAIDAYHDHDLDACLAFYAPDAVVRQIDGTIEMEGSEVVRARYASQMERHPNLRYVSPNRIAVGDYVIDEERITGLTGSSDVKRAALIYRFEGGLIKEIWVIQ